MERTQDPPTLFTDPGDYDRRNSLGVQNDDDLIRPPKFYILVQQSISRYRRLLAGAITLTKRKPLPRNVEDIFYRTSSLSLEDDPFGGPYYAPTSNDWEHKKKVSAAGELFVSKLGIQFLHY